MLNKFWFTQKYQQLTFASQEMPGFFVGTELLGI